MVPSKSLCVTVYDMHCAGAKAVHAGYYSSSTRLPYFLDNLGCNGSESNLLDCLPIHNCGYGRIEDAGAQCLHKGSYQAVIVNLHNR